MKITPKELMELNKWEKYYDLTGMDVWALHEGLDNNELLDISIDELKKLLNLN